MKKQFTVAIAGVGSRGAGTYAPYQKKNPDRMKIVAIADIDPIRLKLTGDEYGVPECMRFDSAEAMMKQPKLADVMIIATQDFQHVSHTMPALERGYDVLLEKPISNDKEDILSLLEKAHETGRKVTVCHVLRYTPFYVKIKELIDSGAVGEVINIHAAENVGYWHQAHSFVRGNWADSNVQSPMILQKCCHDMDIILWLMGQDCVRVSSFGSLSYFNEENAPEGSTKYCMGGCAAKQDCPYDAEKIYVTNNITGIEKGNTNWPCDVLVPEPTSEKVYEAIKSGPYGRCVFHCDNNVVDHQVVNMEFANRATAAFTLSGFTRKMTREIKVCGTLGEIEGNMGTNTVVLHRFGQPAEEFDIAALNKDLEGHGGGDHRMVSEFFDCIERNDAAVRSGIDVSVQSHMICFAAELSRLEDGKPVCL